MPWSLAGSFGQRRESYSRTSLGDAHPRGDLGLGDAEPAAHLGEAESALLGAQLFHSGGDGLLVDGESLHRLQERCEDVSTRPAGLSALVDANLSSSGAGQHVPDSAGEEPVLGA
jgi:hypothetical protein